MVFLEDWVCAGHDMSSSNCTDRSKADRMAPPGLAAVLACLYTGSLVIAGVLAAKAVTLAGVVVPAGVLAYCLTFLCTDIVAELYGRRAATRLVWGGLAALILSLLLIKAAVVWPPASFYRHQEAFAKTLGLAPRIMAASLVAYLFSQFHDVFIFHSLKRLTGGRFLWLRNNLSTALSQLIDSVIFIGLAFWGVMPVWPLIWGQWLVKLALALLDTPFVYLVVLSVRRWAGPSQQEEEAWLVRP